MKRTLKVTFVAAFTAATLLAPVNVSAQFNQDPTAFRFSSNAFWLNLHHFLYVLGRAHTKAPDATLSAVATALPDEERGLATMNPEDVATWRRAVDHYGSGPSSLDAANDETLIATVLDLANTADSPTLLPTTRIDNATRSALESAASIYRRTFWQIHQTANRRFEAHMQALLKTYQRPIFSVLTRAYAKSWPSTGYQVYITPYTNSLGVYGVRGPVIFMASAAPDMRGPLALEAALAEAMHAWDDATSQRLLRAAQAKRIPVDEWLPQGMIYYTVGEAVRRAVPTHVPFATKFNLWAGHERIKQALDAAWMPWLNGTGYSDDAITSLVTRASSAPPPPPARPAARKKR